MSHSMSHTRSCSACEDVLTLMHRHLGSQTSTQPGVEVLEALAKAWNILELSTLKCSFHECSVRLVSFQFGASCRNRLRVGSCHKACGSVHAFRAVPHPPPPTPLPERGRKVEG